MTDFNPCAGMRPDASDTDKMLVRWMFSQPPFSKRINEQHLSEIEYQTLSSRKMSDLSNTEFRKLAAEVRRRAPRFTYNPDDSDYYERAILSCLLNGAPIPAEITEGMFENPKHRIIFRALVKLNALGLYKAHDRGFSGINLEILTAFLSETGTRNRCGGESYLKELERTIGIASAIDIFVLKLLKTSIRRTA
jgi:hypothetical protein